MNKRNININLRVGNKFRVTGYDCGRECSRKFACMGIIKDKIFEVVAIQPMKGPITVKVDNTIITIGRGMIARLTYDKL
jgi:Fe2+ transport system protein FeoA